MGLQPGEKLFLHKQEGLDVATPVSQAAAVLVVPLPPALPPLWTWVRSPAVDKTGTSFPQGIGTGRGPAAGSPGPRGSSLRPQYTRDLLVKGTVFKP